LPYLIVSEAGLLQVFNCDYKLLSSSSSSSGVASYGALGNVPPSTSNSFIFSSLTASYPSIV